VDLFFHVKFKAKKRKLFGNLSPGFVFNVKFKANNPSYNIMAKEIHEPAQIIMPVSSPDGVIGLGECFGANNYVYSGVLWGTWFCIRKALYICLPVNGCCFRKSFLDGSPSCSDMF